MKRIALKKIITITDDPNHPAQLKFISGSSNLTVDIGFNGEQYTLELGLELNGIYTRPEWRTTITSAPSPVYLSNTADYYTYVAQKELLERELHNLIQVYSNNKTASNKAAYEAKKSELDSLAVVAKNEVTTTVTEFKTFLESDFNLTVLGRAFLDDIQLKGVGRIGDYIN